MRAARNPAELLHLVNRFPDADEARPATGGIQDHVRQLPAQVECDLIPHRLFAFQTIRLLECGHVEQADSGCHLGRLAARVADEAVDQVQLRAGHFDFALVRLWRIGGHKDMGG